MKISVDGGAFCVPSSKRFGTYIFSINIIRALSLYDKSNTYFVYSFCNKPHDLYVKNNVFYSVLRPRFSWLNVRVSLEEFIARKKVFLALNQAVPLFTPSRIIGFSHGLSFIHFPQLYGSSYRQLKYKLNRFVKKTDTIIVSSTRVKEDLLHINPLFHSKVKVIPFGIPFDFHGFSEESPSRTSIQARKQYFLFVGMNHPIKNVNFIVDAFLQFISKKQYARFKLCLVGPFFYMKKRPKNIIVHSFVHRDQLRTLYTKATAYVTASLYESFNFPVLEALSQQCPIVGLESAIVPELVDYCHVAHTKEEFVELMEQAAKGETKRISEDKLKKQFSWRRYVDELMKLYKQ